MTHQAAWLNTKHANLVLGPAETPTPGPSELLVRVEVIAFSPIESKLQQFEVHPLTYPNILGLSYVLICLALGSDLLNTAVYFALPSNLVYYQETSADDHLCSFAGTVQSVGPDVKSFAPGDRITTLRPDNKLNDPRYGAFQHYALASTESTAKLLPDTPLEAGAATIANLATVTSALSVFLGLDRPSLDEAAQPKGQNILVYGGSSSSGGLAIGYAKHAGYEVITTSSPRNHDFVASLGPAVIVDHTKSHDDILQDLQAHGPYHRILDTIGLPPVTDLIVDYLSSVGGGNYSTLIPPMSKKPIPDNVQPRFESYGWVFSEPQHSDLRKWLYDELLPKGLATGIVIPTRTQWIEGGLGSCQYALDLMERSEVSGHKLVLNPWQ